MKLVLIVFNQALEEEIMQVLESLNIRGYTQINNVYGRGSNKGEPHLGTHVWPEINTLLLTVIPDEKVENLLNEIRRLNDEFESEGLHAFTLKIEQMV